MKPYYVWNDKGRLNVSPVKPGAEHVIVYQGESTIKWALQTIENYERIQALLKGMVDDEVISRWESEGGLCT
jgi:hypothetical protein